MLVTLARQFCHFFWLSSATFFTVGTKFRHMEMASDSSPGNGTRSGQRWEEPCWNYSKHYGTPAVLATVELRGFCRCLLGVRWWYMIMVEIDSWNLLVRTFHTCPKDILKWSVYGGCPHCFCMHAPTRGLSGGATPRSSIHGDGGLLRLPEMAMDQYL